MACTRDFYIDATPSHINRIALELHEFATQIGRLDIPCSVVCIERRKDQAHKASIHRLVIELCSDICHTELKSVSTKAVDVAASRHTNMRWQYGDMWMRMVPANHTSIALHSNGILLQHVRSIVIFDAIACLTD
jgi:hypothetical protein